MKKTFKTTKELKDFIDTYFVSKSIMSYNVVASDTAITVTWKEAKMDNGLNKVQKQEVKEMIETAVFASEKRTGQKIKQEILKSEKRTNKKTKQEILESEIRNKKEFKKDLIPVYQALNIDTSALEKQIKE